MINQAYRLLKKLGLNSNQLLVPYYWLPYNFGMGRALPPISVHLELTFRCNLRCQMCSLVISNAVETGGFPMNRGGEADDLKELRGTELEYAEYVRLLDDMKRIGTRRVTVTGGEPFIKKDAVKILRHIKKNGFWLSIISNGTVMTDEICETLVTHGADSLTISLDGPEAVHNEVRGSATGFARLKKNVLKLQEWKRNKRSALPHVNFSCAVSALNQDHLSEIVDVAEECGIDDVGFGFLFFTDEATIKATEKFALTGQADFADQRIPMHLRKVDIEKMKAEIRRTKEKGAARGIKVSFNPPLEDHELHARFNDQVYFYTTKCFVPWYDTRINPFGDVYSCQIDTRLGNIREKPLKAIWNDGPYLEFRRLIREHALLPKCSRCCKLQDRLWDRLPSIPFPLGGRARKGSPLGSDLLGPAAPGPGRLPVLDPALSTTRSPSTPA